MEPFDVLVAGGGSAGWAAAITAARAGARTALVERQGCLGGMGTSALVHTLCGLYLIREAPEAVFANPGFASEIAERLIAAGGARGPVRMGRMDVLPHDPVALAHLGDAMLRETPGLRVLLHSEMTGVSRADSGWRVNGMSRGTTWELQGTTLVDATGDATAAFLAGLPVEQVPAERLQRPAYVFKLCGAPEVTLDETERLRLAHGLARAVKDGALAAAALGAGFRRGMHEGELYVTVDLQGDDSDGSAYDPCDPATLSLMEQRGRQVAVQLTAWLRASVAGFAEAWIAAWPARAGVRESRRGVGVHVLQGEELAEGVAFPDTIALATWPMELREKPTGPKWRYFTGNRPGQIPLRALRSAASPTFFVAGRCLSCDHDAQASIRVMGACLATGEAAGAAAALVAAEPGLAELSRHEELAGRVIALRQGCAERD